MTAEAEAAAAGEVAEAKAAAAAAPAAEDAGAPAEDGAADEGSCCTIFGCTNLVTPVYLRVS